MPGLPTRPCFFDIDLDPLTEEVQGLMWDCPGIDVLQTIASIFDFVASQSPVPHPLADGSTAGELQAVHRSTGPTLAGSFLILVLLVIFIEMKIDDLSCFELLLNQCVCFCHTCRESPSNFLGHKRSNSNLDIRCTNPLSPFYFFSQ